MPGAIPCADAPHTSAQAASAAIDNQQETSTRGSQHAANHFQPAANSGSHVPANGVSNGTAKQAAANSHKRSELHSPPAGQAQDTANTAGLPEGGTLIVCPTAVLNQWARELEAKVAPPAGKPALSCNIGHILLLSSLCKSNALDILLALDVLLALTPQDNVHCHWIQPAGQSRKAIAMLFST